MIYIVAYDLNKQGKDYDGLFKAIQSYPDNINCQKSVWLISTNATAENIYDTLKPHIDGDDFILITNWGNSYRALLSPGVVNWLKNHGIG